MWWDQRSFDEADSCGLFGTRLDEVHSREATGVGGRDLNRAVAAVIVVVEVADRADLGEAVSIGRT